MVYSLTQPLKYCIITSVIESEYYDLFGFGRSHQEQEALHVFRGRCDQRVVPPRVQSGISLSVFTSKMS